MGKGGILSQNRERKVNSFSLSITFGEEERRSGLFKLQHIEGGRYGFSLLSCEGGA